MMLALAALALPSYGIVGLGAPPEAEGVEAVAINGRGEVLVRVQETVVVPWFSSKGEGHVPVRRGYLWRAGRFLSLGEAERTGTFDPPSIEPLALNDLSVAVGLEGDRYARLHVGPEREHRHHLARPWAGGPWARTPQARRKGINNLGDVVGGGGHRAFARLRGRIVWIAPLSRIIPADPSGEMNDANQCSRRRDQRPAARS